MRVSVPKLVVHQPTRDLVARNLKRLLAAKPMTVNVLSAKSTVVRSVVYRIWNADTGVTIDVLGRLADVLGCGVVEFFREKKER